jgi:peptidoglycan/LPS O-acetylase OafA/YrhL
VGAVEDGEGSPDAKIVTPDNENLSATSGSNPGRQSVAHIAGLDSLRFVLAIWVVLFHVGGYPFSLFENARAGVPYLLRGFYHNLWNGQAAVVAFFVISGLCIHFPYRDRPVPQRLFFLRRSVRILVPMLLGLALYRAERLPFSFVNQGFLWSLICEEIYYLLYPAIWLLRQRFGWIPIIASSSVAAVMVCATNLAAMNLDDLGVAVIWIAGLPCWLLGCVIAEQIAVHRHVGREIWIWRLAAILLSETLMVLRNHLGIGLPLPLLVFSLFCFHWVRREIDYYRERAPIRALERAGAWSYSLYLIHLAVYIPLRRIQLPASSAPLRWLLAIAAIFTASYLFYRLVEHPSHRLARWAAAVVETRALAR